MRHFFSVLTAILLMLIAVGSAAAQTLPIRPVFLAPGIHGGRGVAGRNQVRNGIATEGIVVVYGRFT